MFVVCALCLEYTPNREICLPELLFSEIVPTRDPRLLAVRPESSIYFDMAKAFAKGIPPEDWYETSPDEDDWNGRANKVLVHLPVNSLYRPENKETVDRCLQLEHIAVSCTETMSDHVTTTDTVVPGVDWHSVPGGVASGKTTESRDSDSDDERISRVIQSCMEPVVINVKTEPSDDGDGNNSNTNSPTVRSTMAVTEGKAQRLMKLKQSGISPDMLRRRLQKIEEKLSALRNRSKTSAEVPQIGKPADDSESQSVDYVSKIVTDVIPQNQSDISASHTSRSEADSRSCMLLDQAETVMEDVTLDRISAFDNFPLNLTVNTTLAGLQKTSSKPLSGSSVHSDRMAECPSVSRQQQKVMPDSRNLQSVLEPASNPPHADRVGNQMDDASGDQVSQHLPWCVGCLSLDTKWDSQFIESQSVRRTLLDAMRNWRLRKPIDLIMSGQLRDVPLDWTPMKTTWKTDSTVDCCWNSVLWYFGALLGEPAGPYSQQLMTASTEDVGTSRVQVLPDDEEEEEEDWWGIGRDKVHSHRVDPTEDRQKSDNIQSSLLSSEKQAVPLPVPGTDIPKSSQSAMVPVAEKNTSQPSSGTVESIISPSVKLPSATAVDGGRKSPVRSSSSRKEKSEPSDVQKLSESTSRDSTKPSSQKHRRKHEDKKKSRRNRPSENSSSNSAEQVKDSGVRGHDTKKENKRSTANDKETEKHSKKIKKHNKDADDVKDKIKKHLESVESNRADIADLLRVFVGTDETKLSLLSKAVGNVKQFNSNKLTTATSLHWAVALALLDENASGNSASVPASLWSEQLPNSGSETAAQLNDNKGIATESSVKRVFDSVSDFMNAILSGKPSIDFSDTKSGAANGLSASHLDELRFSESDNGPSCSPANTEIPVASMEIPVAITEIPLATTEIPIASTEIPIAIAEIPIAITEIPIVSKIEVESEEAEDKNFNQKDESVSTLDENSDDVVVVGEMKTIKVVTRAIEMQNFVLPEENENRKVVLSKQVIASEGLTIRVEPDRKQQEQKTVAEAEKKSSASDDAEDTDDKQLRKLSSIVGKALINLRGEHSRQDDRKDSRSHRSKKDPSAAADKGTANSSTSRQTGTKRKQGSSHRSERENSKHSRHEKKTSSHDRHKKTATSEKRTSKDRPFTSSFEIISDTELEGQSTSVNQDRKSRTSKQHTRARGTKTAADDKVKTDDAHVDSTSNVPSKRDKQSGTTANIDNVTAPLVQKEKLPVPPVSTSQSSVTSSSGSSNTLAHIAFHPSAIYKMASSATVPPVKTATTDMFLASRGPRFMQTFRRSQIAKRRSQRESQQTATGGKLLTPAYGPPNSMVIAKPVVRPIGLSLEATLAALSTTTTTSQPENSAPQSSRTEDSSVVVSSSTCTSSPSVTASVSHPLLSVTNTDAEKSPLKLNSTSLVDDATTTVDLQTVPPLPSSPTAAGGDRALPLSEDTACDSRTTSVAGSPPPDLSLLCVDTSSTNLDNSEPFDHVPVVNQSASLPDAASHSFASLYPAMQGYGSLSSVGMLSEQYFGFQSAYWMSGYMPSHGAYGYESSMYTSAYPWYYGHAWNMMHHPPVMPVPPPPAVPPHPPDSAPPSFDELASGDESYGSLPPPLPPPPLPPDTSFSSASTSQQETVNPWPALTQSPASHGNEPPSEFLSHTLPNIPITNRLRAPPRLSSDEEPVQPQKSPLLPTPVQPPSDIIPPLIPVTHSSSPGEETSDKTTECRPTECRPLIPPQKKRFFVYSNNVQLKAQVTVSIIAHTI